jgi:hypothetical protein
MEPKTWTRSEIETLLNRNNRAVERAMVAIWKRQTRDEQRTDSTQHHNGVGFSGWTARSGSYFANWVLGGGRLTGKHLKRARKIALHHAGQLTDIANGLK